MLKTAVGRVGKRPGVTLPGTMIENYNLSEGGELHLLETDDGVLLTPIRPTFAQWAESSGKAQKRYRKTLRNLAK